jgi:hypothetical protein
MVVRHFLSWTEPFLMQIKKGFLKYPLNPFLARTFFEGSVFYPIAEPIKKVLENTFFFFRVSMCEQEDFLVQEWSQFIFIPYINSITNLLNNRFLSLSNFSDGNFLLL